MVLRKITSSPFLFSFHIIVVCFFRKHVDVKVTKRKLAKLSRKGEPTSPREVADESRGRKEEGKESVSSNNVCSDQTFVPC